jgi:hypothetical protein
MKLFLFFILSVFTVNLSGQECFIDNTPIEQKIDQSNNIVIGEISATYSFWRGQMIFTQFQINPLVNFKSIKTEPFFIEVEGGQVGLERLKVFPGFIPINGEKVLLYLDENFRLSNGILSIKYISNSEIHKDELSQISNATNVFYPSFEEISARPTTDALGISSFTPTSVSAGTGQTLTINGSGFGSSRGNGYVEFKNANDGGNTWVRPLASEYVSWTDSKIEVKVTASSGGGANNGMAGSGKIRVFENSGASATSKDDLIVIFSRLNVVYGGEPFQTKHINQNNNGGYTFAYHPSFPASAKVAFESELNDWRCGILVNFGIGQSTSTAKPARDGENIIRFSDPNEMPQSVLGITYIWWVGCTAKEWYLVEIDMMYNSDQSFYFGEGSTPTGQIDFRTVVLHEIGHAVQLGHVINSKESMHFSVAKGQSKRKLSGRDKEGGKFVMNQISTTNSCRQGTMSLLNANNCNSGVASKGGLAKADENSVTLGGSTTIRLTNHIGNIQWQQRTTGDNYSDISGANAENYSTGELFQTTWYRAKVKNGTIQEAFSNEEKVNAGLTSVGEFSFVSSFFPNPVVDVLNLDFSEEGSYQFSIVDLAGRKLLIDQKKLVGNYSLNLSFIPAGIYLLEIKNKKQQTQWVKIIKK